MTMRVIIINAANRTGDELDIHLSPHLQRTLKPGEQADIQVPNDGSAYEITLHHRPQQDHDEWDGDKVVTVERVA